MERVNVYNAIGSVCIYIVAKTKNELENYLNHGGTFWDQKFGLKLKHIKGEMRVVVVPSGQC